MLVGGRAKLPAHATSGGCGCAAPTPSFGLLEFYRARGMGHIAHPCGCSSSGETQNAEALGGPLAVSLPLPAIRSWTHPAKRFPPRSSDTPFHRTSWNRSSRQVETATSSQPAHGTATGVGDGTPLVYTRGLGATRRTGASSKRTSGPVGTVGAGRLWDVDIYLSAGEVTGLPGTAGYRSCDLDDVGSCKIYRIGWNFRSMRAVYVEEVVAPAAFPFGTKVCRGGLGAIQPALSPDGTRLAWAEACRDSAWATTSQDIHVGGPGGGSSYSVANPGGQYRDFPEWYDNTTLLYGSGGGSVWSHGVDGHTSVAKAGPAAGGTREYQNPRVHPAPGYQGGAPRPRMVTFGGVPGLLQPQVSDTSGGRPAAFDLGTDPTFEQCHHPAWNPDGTKVMCARQSVPLTRGVAPLDHQEQPLYTFTYSRWTGRWSNGVEAFTSPDQAALETAMGTNLVLNKPMFPQNTGAGTFCRVRVWKYAQWCHDENFLIATLFCTDTNAIPAFGFGVFTSRVVLVDNRAPASPVFHDLTSAVEHHQGLTVGTLHGIFATCGTPGCLYSS